MQSPKNLGLTLFASIESYVLPTNESSHSPLKSMLKPEPSSKLQRCVIELNLAKIGHYLTLHNDFVLTKTRKSRYPPFFDSASYFTHINKAIPPQ